MSERIMTLHPAGKTGVNIDRQKYDVVREAILEAVRINGTITFSDLTAEVRSRLKATFAGSISWYVTTVKLDLEARGEIVRLQKSGPQRLTLL